MFPFFLSGGCGCCAEQREEETNRCFHRGFVAFIILLRDLPAKVAEDFAARGGQESGVGGLYFEARRVLPRRVAVNN